MRRTQPGQRQTVKNEEYFCHAHNREGLVGIAFADGEYPARAGFGVVNKILDEFLDISANKWRSANEDCTEAMPVLEPALQKYQVIIGKKEHIEQSRFDVVIPFAMFHSHRQGLSTTVSSSDHWDAKSLKGM